MLFFGYGWKTHRFQAFPSTRMRIAAFPILAALCLALDNPAMAAGPAAAEPAPHAWMQVEETVVPLRDNTTRNAIIRGFARKGQVVAVERTTENWVKVRANDTLEGWVPAASLSPSGPPVNLNP